MLIRPSFGVFQENLGAASIREPQCSAISQHGSNNFDRGKEKVMQPYWDDFPSYLALCELTLARAPVPARIEPAAGRVAPRPAHLLVVSALCLAALWSGLGTERSGAPLNPLRPMTANQEIAHEPHRPL
jgi:hypothetical protein